MLASLIGHTYFKVYWMACHVNIIKSNPYKQVAKTGDGQQRTEVAALTSCFVSRDDKLG